MAAEAEKTGGPAVGVAIAGMGVVGALLLGGGLLGLASGPQAWASGTAAVEAKARQASEQEAAAKEAELEAEEAARAGEGEPSDPRDEAKKIDPSDTVRHVAAGDTLTLISGESGISVDRLAEYNSISDVDVIYEGSALRIPYVLIPATE